MPTPPAEAADAAASPTGPSVAATVAVPPGGSTVDPATSDGEPSPSPVTRRTDGQVLVGRVALVAIGGYVGLQVVSQVTSLKIGTTFGRAVDMGTFVYPLTFTLRDVIHKAAGRRAARIAILTSAGVNLFLAAYLTWVAGRPSDPSYPLGDEFSAVLGPLWRIVIASLLAMVVSELIDTEVYHWWVTRVTTRFQWLRVLVSNAVSVPVDNLIFALGAFAPLFFLSPHQQDISLPWTAVWEIFWVNLVLKGLVSVASIPLIYATPDRHLADA